MMGMVRVCCSINAVMGVFCVRMRSGCSPTSSFVNRRYKSASAAAQRASIRMLRPSVHPSFWSPPGMPRNWPVLPGRVRTPNGPGPCPRSRAHKTSDRPSSPAPHDIAPAPSECARNERFGDSNVFRCVFERIVGTCIAAGLVGGEGFAVDASLIQADANKHRSIRGAEWHKDIDPEQARRAVKEYLATLDTPAYGAASDVTPKFVSPSDPAAPARPLANLRFTATTRAYGLRAFCRTNMA